MHTGFDFRDRAVVDFDLGWLALDEDAKGRYNGPFLN